MGLGFAALALGCGSRGAPLPPIRPIPPAITDMRVDQVGVVATLDFPYPAARFFVGDEQVEVGRLELLMATERHPAITPEMLALALDAERGVRLQAAREVARRVRGERSQRRIAEQLRIATEAALAAGEPPPTLESLGLQQPQEAEPDDSETALSDDELVLRRVPRSTLNDWRKSGVRPDMVLDAARRLEFAVDLLWSELDLPIAVVDLSEPPVLPDPDELIAAAARVARDLEYEGSIEPTEFLERAVVVESIDYADLEQDTSGARGVVRHNIGLVSPGPTRTRYYFTARIVVGDKYEGLVSTIASLAPANVPVAPAGVAASVSVAGVMLEWPEVTADVWGESLSADQVRYNVYRRLSDQEALPRLPLNLAPLLTNTFSDLTTTWGQSYVYQVRALGATEAREDAAVDLDPSLVAAAVTSAPIGPRKESAGSDTEEVLVEDVFPPAAITGLTATRAANRITLRWLSPSPLTVAGFRVYRHEAPAPPIPSFAPREDPVEKDEAAEPGAVQAADAVTEAAPDNPLAAAAEALCPVLPDPLAVAAPLQTGGRRRRMNALVGDDWAVLTAPLTTSLLYLDPIASADTAWVYLVAAVDEAGNAGPLACVGITAQDNP